MKEKNYSGFCLCKALNESKDADWRCEFSLVQNMKWILKELEFFCLLLLVLVPVQADTWAWEADPKDAG